MYSPSQSKIDWVFYAQILKKINKMKVKQQIRDKFRKEVFERDGFKCKVCGIGGVMSF